jgi:hypothetical protein
MEYLLYYFAGILILVVGYVLGVIDERKNGPAADQKRLDIEVAAYYGMKNEFAELEESLRCIDNEVSSKSIIKFSNS